MKLLAVLTRLMNRLPIKILVFMISQIWSKSKTTRWFRKKNRIKGSNLMKIMPLYVLIRKIKTKIMKGLMKLFRN